MMAGIRSVKIEGREFANEVIWSTPNLYVRAMGDCYISDNECQYKAMVRNGRHALSVRRKLDIPDSFVEVEMMEHHASFEVNQKCATIFFMV